MIGDSGTAWRSAALIKKVLCLAVDKLGLSEN